MSTVNAGSGRPKSHRGGKRSTSWGPGVSGNPRGRPSGGVSWRSLITDFAGRETPASARAIGATWGEAIIAKAFHKVLAEGEAGILRLLIERSDAAPPGTAASETDLENVRRQVELEFRVQVAEEDKKSIEKVRGDPEREKRLLELLAARLDLNAQIAELVGHGAEVSE